MKSLHSFFLSTHRVLGTVTSILLVGWFFSAFFMLFVQYPRYSRQEMNMHAPRLVSTMSVDTTSLRYMIGQSLSLIPDSIRGQVSGLSLERHQEDGFILNVRTRNTERLSLKMDGSEQKMRPPTEADFDRIARSISPKSNILSIDSLSTLDQWTPFSRLRKDLPFIRLHLDRHGHQIYLSSRDGRVLTEHTTSERILAWLGPIPHWVYFTFIRQNADLWRNLIIILSGIALFMSIGGLYIGIDMYRKRYRSKGDFHSPYTKGSYRWHHVTGTIGGILIITWLLSGLFSVVDIPRWLGGGEDSDGTRALSGKTLPLEQYQSIEQLPVDVLAPSTVSIKWSSLGHVPLIQFVQHDSSTISFLYIDSRWIPSKEVVDTHFYEPIIRTAYGKEHDITIDTFLGYDGYYLSRGSDDCSDGAEIIRINVSSADGAPCVYIKPLDGSIRIIDRTDRIRMWLYMKLHTLRFGFLGESETARIGLNLLFLTIGFITSLTGLILSVRYIKRKLRNRYTRL